MRGPAPTPIELTDAERSALETLVRRHTTPQQLALRARVVLAAADGLNNTQIATLLQRSLPFVRRWRDRWHGLQVLPLDPFPVEERLTDIPRPGRPIQISDTQVCQIVRIACEAPSASGRPITEWTGREIADEAVRRKIVERISPRHAARLVKRGISSRTGFVPGSLARKTRSSTPK